jgi:hypothetical protein
MKWSKSMPHPKESRMTLNKKEATTIKLTNFTQSIETLQTPQ